MRKLFYSLSSVIVGGILYIGLNWIPIAGPLIVGFIAGWIRRGNSKEGFNAGIYSGLLGFIALTALLYKWGALNARGIETFVVMLIAWIIFLWNLVGILLAGLGGLVGSMFHATKNFFLGGRREDVKPAGGYFNRGVTFKICPDCGSGNTEDAIKCGNCGAALN